MIAATENAEGEGSDSSTLRAQPSKALRDCPRSPRRSLPLLPQQRQTQDQHWKQLRPPTAPRRHPYSPSVPMWGHRRRLARRSVRILAPLCLGFSLIHSGRCLFVQATTVDLNEVFANYFTPSEMDSFANWQGASGATRFIFVPAHHT